MTFTDEELRAAVRAQLPQSIFKRRPWRVCYAFVLVALIVACGWGAMRAPWYFAAPLALISGHLYGILMFLGHEVAHGAIVASRRIQDIILLACGAIFCVTPQLWRVWHNGVHHGHANVEGRDPDHYGTLERFRRDGSKMRAFLLQCAPGSGHLLSLSYLFIFFSIQCQGVLWIDSKGQNDYRALDRRRAKIESALVFLCWVALCILTGWRGTLYLVVLPMIAANFTVMSYIVTNHLLRPLNERASALNGTMSVKTLPIIDRMHFNFSHHIEHHLFPSVSSKHYPMIRRKLQELAGDRYMAPAHWWALTVLYKTPRLYDGSAELVDPNSGKRVALASVEELLQLH